MTRAATQPGNSIIDRAHVARAPDVPKWIKFAIGLVVLGVGAVVWAFGTFEPKDSAAGKATVLSTAAEKHESGQHPETVEDLHKFEVRMTRVEIEHVHRGRQMVYLVDEIEKIGKRVGSKPAAPPVMPDAAPAAGGTP